MPNVIVNESDDQVEITLPRNHAEFAFRVLSMIGLEEYNYLATQDRKYAERFSAEPMEWPEYFDSGAVEITQNILEEAVKVFPHLEA